MKLRKTVETLSFVFVVVGAPLAAAQSLGTQVGVGINLGGVGIGTGMNASASAPGSAVRTEAAMEVAAPSPRMHVETHTHAQGETQARYGTTARAVAQGEATMKRTRQTIGASSTMTGQLNVPATAAIGAAGAVTAGR
jgi:hypothetical protein